jgi:predicted unusual protein kinase regulating ubiquinone biosynthesis (AarF/ABC1/UbiB family)
MDQALLTELLERLSKHHDARIPTSVFGRLQRTARAGAKIGMGAIASRLRGAELNLSALSPEALVSLVESFGELKAIAMKAGQILSYVDGSLNDEARQILSVLKVHSQPMPFH